MRTSGDLRIFAETLNARWDDSLAVGQPSDIEIDTEAQLTVFSAS